jgi:protein-disulfide isomerase
MTDEGNRPKKHRILWTLAVVFLLPIAFVAVWFAWQVTAYTIEIKKGGLSLDERRMEQSISKLVANSNVTPADLARLVPTAGLYPEWGPSSAKITVVEFIDYACPYTHDAHPIARRLMTAFGQRVRFVMRDYPITEIHPMAKQTALAANCVLEQGQDPYWRFHDAIFSDTWGEDGLPQHQASVDVRAKAEQAGARMQEYDACVASERYLKKIDADIQTAVQAGVQGTPTFFVIANNKAVPIPGAPKDEKTLTRVINAVMEAMPK